MHRRRLNLLAVLTGILALLALGVSLAPAEAVTQYAAGFERAGTHICRCPVQYGDCVCEWKTL